MKPVSCVKIAFILLASLLSACGFHDYPPSQSLVASDDVPEMIAQKARSLVEAQTMLKESLQKDRLVYIGTERVRQKTEHGEDHPETIYRVIHYRYRDDAAILSDVNMEKAVMLQQIVKPHLPTSLSQEELKTASELAMKDSQVREALGKDVENVKIEALVIRAVSEEDPWFGHRVMQLLFRVGRDYRHQPRVIVDLTTNRVEVEPEEEKKQ